MNKENAVCVPFINCFIKEKKIAKSNNKRETTNILIKIILQKDFLKIVQFDMSN